MKRLIFSILTLATVLAVSAMPKAKWLETTYNFGAFEENDGNVTCHFRVVNEGDEPLMIVAVRTSCGCTTSTPPREPVMPGDTATVSATYNPSGRPGRFEKKVYVETNGEQKNFTLTIHGTVIGDTNTLRSRYPVDKGTLKLRTTVLPFGEVKKGNAKSEFFEIYNASSDTIYPQWKSLPKYLRANAVTDGVPPGEQQSFAMIFDSSAKEVPYGMVNDTIYISACTGEEDIPVSVVAMVSENFSRMTPKELAEAPVISADTKSLDFGTFSKDAPATRSFTITNTGKNPLLVRRVYSADPGVTVSISTDKIKRGKKATVTVTVDPSQLPSDVLNARISLITNDPENSNLTVRAVGFPE